MNPQNSPTSAAADSPGVGSATQSGNAFTETKSQLAQSARDTAAKVKSTVGDTASRAKARVGRIAAETRETAANRIGGYGDAIHDSARSLEEKDPNIAWFTHRAADKVQGVADYLRSRDFADVRHDVEDIAHRHPVLFFGGLFVAGLMLGNVVKASRRKLDENHVRDFSREDDISKWSSQPAQPASESSPNAQPDLSSAERGAGGI